ncbi:MAG: DUF3662 domain-containing protein [Chloroflexi bacterium]|nr:DUF3662 domain-containing protein [Chloroflexota bacterium]
MKRRSFSRFETLAQRLVEDSFKRLFGEQLEAHEVATKLARTMEDSRMGDRVADVYTARLHPDDLERLLAQRPSLSQELADYLADLARQADMILAAPPQVTLTADTAALRHRVQVRAKPASQPDDPTTQIHARRGVEDEILTALRQRDAYLIVGGRRHVPLDRPLLTLGRRADNDIVLESATVSRQHAQIRWRYGRFVLYDLSRRGRTLVNNQPVEQHALQPGDVIALSRTLIVYGEGRDEDAPEPAADEDGLTLQLPKVDDGS